MTAPHPPAPPGALRPWRPGVADPGRFDPPPEPTPVDGGHPGDGGGDRAARGPRRSSGRSNGPDSPRGCARPTPGAQDSAGTTGLPRIRSLAVIAVVDGRTCAPRSGPGARGRPSRPPARSRPRGAAHRPPGGPRHDAHPARRPRPRRPARPLGRHCAGAGDGRFRPHPRGAGRTAPRRVLLPLRRRGRPPAQALRRRRPARRTPRPRLR